MIKANTDYSIGILKRMSDVVSCIEYNDGKLRVVTDDGKMHVFNEIIPNHWVRTDSNMKAPFSRERLS